MSAKSRFRPCVETLDNRITPSITEGGVATFTGVLAVTPPTAPAPVQTVHIHQQVSAVTLPSGDVLPGHGLKTAEAHTSVVDWTPT
jgi:hypothetical protein